MARWSTGPRCGLTTILASDTTLPEGQSRIELEFLDGGGGAGKGGDAIMRLDGTDVDRTRIEPTVAGRLGIDTFGIGCDTGSPVSGDYTAPFTYTGTIGRVDIEIGEPDLDPAEEVELHARFTAGKER